MVPPGPVGLHTEHLVRREASHLLKKGCDSLVLSVEFFNRPADRGRPTAVLLLLHHGFEMLLKAAIVHKGGNIRRPRDREAIGFDTALGRSLSDGDIRFLSEEQAITLRAISELRNAAQHYFVTVSEGLLYLHLQSGITIFRDVLESVFGVALAQYLPNRTLPISTTPPTDIATLFDTEVEEVRRLLKPGTRRRSEAFGRLRALAIFNTAIGGGEGQPSDTELGILGKDLVQGLDWARVFEGVAMVSLITDGSGPSLSVRLSKREGAPVHVVDEGTPGAAVLATRRVSDTDFYSLGANDLAKKVGLTVPRLGAVATHIALQEDADCFKEIRIGKSLHRRYSPKAIERLKETLAEKDVDEIWRSQQASKKAARKRTTR